MHQQCHFLLPAGRIRRHI